MDLFAHLERPVVEHRYLPRRDIIMQTRVVAVSYIHCRIAC